MADYIIKKSQFERDGFEMLIGLFNQSFPKAHKFTNDFLKWQYLDNPNGKVVSFNAWTEEGEMAGHYATIPIKMMIGGCVEKGLLSLNTATHPKHQGKGLFVKLATTTYDYAKMNDFKFVIGVANANSTHGFIKRLGFDMIASLEVKIGIGDAYAKEMTEGKNYVFYDPEILAWRLKCPQFSYSSKGDTIYGSIDKPLFHTSVGKLPVGITKEDMGLKKTFDVFNLYVGIGANLGGYYFNLPKFIKRSPFNLIFRDLTGGDLPKITKDNLFFQLLDYDVA